MNIPFKEKIRMLLTRKWVNHVFVRPLVCVAGVFRLVCRIPVCGDIVFEGFDGHKLCMNSNGLDPIASRLFWQGLEGYEPETTRLLPVLCQKPGVVIDIGANTGLMSLLLCSCPGQKQVYAFEPVGRIFKSLENNIALNGFAKQCRCMNMAVSSTDGEVEFFVPRVRPFPQSASLDAEFRPDCEKITVQSVSLDGFVTGQGIEEVSVVKIDVESAAAFVLEGMGKVLSRMQPYVVCEVLPQADLKTLDGVLAASAYRAWNIRPEGLLECKGFASWEFDSFHNFLLARTLPQSLLATAL